MSKLSAEAVYERIAATIGPDVSYLSTNDEARHFDSATVLLGFAGLLVLKFAQGFVEATSNEASELGKKTWLRLSAVVKGFIAQNPPESESKLAEQEQLVTEVLALVRELEETLETSSTVRCTTEARLQVSMFLRQYHFPEDRSLEISQEVLVSVLDDRLV